MRSFFTKNGRVLAISILVSVGIMLIFSATFMLSDYKTEIADRANSMARYNTSLVVDDIQDNLDAYVLKATNIAGGINAYDDDEQGWRDYLFTVENGLIDESDVNNIISCRYFCDDLAYSVDGELYTKVDSVVKYRETNKDKAGYTGIFTETEDSRPMELIAFYAPVLNCSFCDGVAIYYTREKLETMFSVGYTSENAEFSLLTDNNGIIIVGDDSQSQVLVGGETVRQGDISVILRKSIGKKEVFDTLSNLLKSDFGGTVTATVNTEDYVISVGTRKSDMNGLAVVELYAVNTLCASGLDFVYSVIAIIIIFALIVIGTILYLVFRNVSISKKLFNSETMDTTFNCLNRHGFEQEVKPIINNNKTSYFAMVVLQVRHLKHLQETLGESEVNNLIKYIDLGIRQFLVEEERYGYNEDGQFLMFLHAKDRQGLIDRLKVLTFAISKYKTSKKHNILLKYGIYEKSDDENLSVSQMIDYANEANNAIVNVAKGSSNLNFNFYDEELRKTRLINEDMELRMDGALANGEFQVFYQPKYNLNKNAQDGCEALVRWYDKKAGVYNRPALFMALFEANGFIIKLDKYVFTKVCEYINYSIAKGRPVYPVSVNVSRVTAIQPDFIDFYVKTKKKYGVSDNLLMIEFTESFAYENYETLSKIVDSLHENGFKCSIDDFGCGYSSYRILKSLAMDEIKLDKFFMESGFDHDRDQNIFESIIALAKKINMKVTQEGIETKEGVDRLRLLGCDVIQGYYYSRPLPLTDYIAFVQNSRDHNIN